MGHLVNATSMRIGWTSTWKDLFYLKFFCHSDYIHHLLRIRYFLIFMFFAKTPWDALVITYSHFTIHKLRRDFNVMIFVYLGKLMLMQDYMEYLYKGYMRYLGRFSSKSGFMNITERKIVFWIRLLFLFMRGGWTKDNDLWTYRELRLDKRSLFHRTGIHFLRRDNTKVFIHKAVISYLSAKNLSHSFGLKSKYLRQKYFYIRFLNSFLDTGIFKWQDFWDILFAGHIHTPFFSWYKDYIEYLIYFVILSKNIIVSFIHSTNDDVTPTFLSRYMMRKLDQLFTWRQILAPIRTELGKVIPVKFEIDSFTGSSFDYEDVNLVNSVYTTILNTVNVFLNFYDVYIINNKYKYYIWINFNLCDKTTPLTSNLYYKYMSFISLSMYVSDFIVDYNRKYEYSLWWNISNYNSDYYNYMLSKIFCVYPFNTKLFINTGNMLLLESYNHAYINSLKYAYKHISYYVDKEFSHVLNEYNMRFVDVLQKDVKFQGYKIFLKGRLSRRQRASFFRLSFGKMPLNTFSASIDHGAYMLPIKNSALTINIWFCSPFEDSAEYMEKDPDSCTYINAKRYLNRYKAKLKWGHKFIKKNKK